MKVRLWNSLMLALLALMAAVPAVSAHRPLWAEGAGVTEIPNIVTSFAVYRDLRAADAADVYAFEAGAGDHLHAGINIPAIGGLEQYGVSVALVGPGLPPAEPGLLPLELTEELGAVIFPSVPGADFYEPFTQTSYWGRQRIEIDLPQAGAYYLVVWQPDGAAGKYVLDTGTAEEFGPSDLFQFPIWWLRVHAFFGHTPYMAAALIAVIALAGFVYLRRRPAFAPASRPGAAQ